jgi:hypothetical protein
MNDATAWSIVATIGGIVLAVLIVCLTCIRQDEMRRALENGYEQRPIYPGSSNLMWVKAPVSATCAR